MEHSEHYDQDTSIGKVGFMTPAATAAGGRWHGQRGEGAEAREITGAGRHTQATGVGMMRRGGKGEVHVRKESDFDVCWK